jgi:hypothetical protein
MLLRVPEGWPTPLVAGLAMVVLALLDLGGAIAAKEAVERRSATAAAVGVLLFVLLFWVFASSLQVAELGPVTFGWVVILQVGVLLLDRFKYGVDLPAGKWIAVGVLLVAQAYLLLAPDRPASSAPAAAAERITVPAAHPVILLPEVADVLPNPVAAIPRQRTVAEVPRHPAPRPASIAARHAARG